MYYPQYETVKAMVAERLHRASAHRLSGADAGERDGPIQRMRHRAGHALIVAGEMVAHGGPTVAHGVHDLRHAD